MAMCNTPMCHTPMLPMLPMLQEPDAATISTLLEAAPGLFVLSRGKLAVTNARDHAHNLEKVGCLLSYHP